MKHFTTHLHPRPLFAALLLALLNCLPAAAEYFTVDGLRFYTISNTTCSLTRPSSGKYEGDITIPSEVTSYSGRTYSVTDIGYSVFKGCTGLTSVTIPNSVTSIWDNAFDGCTGLTSVTIPNSVTSIKGSTFQGCTGLISVTIPNSVTSIKGCTFQGCTGLTSVTIPNSVTSIESYAFDGCTGLTSVTIPNSVTSIGRGAFSGCTGLTSVTIPNSVTSIGEWAFSGCTGLTSVTIPNSVTSIESYAFSGCTGLTSVTIPNSVTSIESYAFSGCTGLTSVTIPNSVTSIESYAFSGCTGLTSVTIPNSVTSIGRGAFSGCTGLKSINVDTNNKKYYSIDGILYSKDKKTLIAVPGGLTSVTIPNSVTSIGEWAFSGCTGLTSVTIPNSVTSIGERAFQGCSSLTSVTIPNSMWVIASSAFLECSLDYIIINGNSLYECAFLEHFSCKAVYVTESLISRVSTWWKGTPSVIVSTSTQTAQSALLLTTSALYPSSIVLQEVENHPIPVTLTSVEYGGTIVTPDADGKYVVKGLTPCSSNRLKVCYTTLGVDGIQVVEPYVTTPDFAQLSAVETGQSYVKLKVTLADDPYGETPSEYGVNFNRRYYQADKDGLVTISGLQTNSEYTSSFRPYMKLSDGTTYTGNDIRVKTRSLNPSLTLVSSSPTTVVLQSSYSKGDAEVMATGITGYEASGAQMTLTGLTPDYNYTFTYFVKTKDGYQETYDLKVKTPAIEWETLPAKATSNTMALICANTNIDEAETNTGFEWRRYDAPDLVPSTQAPCPVVGGTLTGALKNLSAGTYYKFRPYYTSSAGTTYYGEWLAFGTADAYVYFDPTVRTYEATEVGSSSARVKGFAIGGSDDITEQGFEYWKTSGAATSLKRALAPLAAAEGTQTVLSSGQWMTATLDNLEPGTTYTFRAYVKTASATTYGEEMTFTTDFPTGIGQVETTGEAVEVARFTVDGRRINAPQKGINLIRMSDGTTRKVYVK